MQEIKVIEPAKARSVLLNTDIQQGLETGRLLLAVKVKKPTYHAIAQRAFKRRCSEAGFKRLDVLLEERIYNALLARRQSGETLAAIIKRLLNLPDAADHISIAETDK